MPTSLTMTATRPFRLALLTPEYVTDHPDGGGLASYLGRLTTLMRGLGHEAEVFTLGDEPAKIEHEGVRVERVVPVDNLPLRLLGSHWRPRLALGGTLAQLRGALAMAQAMERRHLAQPFDAVQSSDWGLAGYFVKPMPQRPHLLRCSWSRPLYQAHSGAADTLDHRMLSRLERRCLRRADVAYAPSAFIAQHLSERCGMPVRIVRPPMMTPLDIDAPLPDDLVPPGRYMIHFGQLSRLKGTDVVQAALPIAWRSEPGLRVVFVGRASEPAIVEALHAGAPRTTWTGPLPRRTLFALLRGAVAAVLPSRCDNLPNAVIESLSLGVPVIGSNGASIDELVESGRSGRLTPIGDAAALAEAMVELWRRPVRVDGAALAANATWAAMRPDVAVEALIEAARGAKFAKRAAA